MSLMILAAMMMAQAPGASDPAITVPAPVATPAIKKQKPAQVCEYIEITGSRSKRRVCRDAEGNLDLGPGVSNNAFGKGTLHQESGAPAPAGGPGGSN